jgi:hypothetical protein
MRRLSFLLTTIVGLGCVSSHTVNLVAHGGMRPMRERADRTRPSDPGSPPILLIALDGASRGLVYDLLREGEMPELAGLLGGRPFTHAYFSDDLLTIFPSITMASWATALTGHPPAEHGVAGNEYFIRERRVLACPSPISFVDNSPTIETYSDGYLDKLVEERTVYERIHDADPDALVWVSLGQLARGADALLLTKRTALLDAAEAYVADQTTSSPTRDVYAVLDDGVIDEIVSQLDRGGPVPDLLTVYMPGIDTYAHVANEGPDRARRAYLTEVVDPALGRLAAALRRRGALAGRWVIVTADHGHTEVLHDDHHAIATDAPKAVLESVGFRVRPFKRFVADEDPFSAVVAYGGATAYVYLADRSRCAGAKDVCPWDAPPRYREDVLAAAEAFRKANEDGTAAPALRGTLDLILVREPRPWREVDRPFEVYVGGGKTMPVDAYLAAHPHPTYVDLDARLRMLAVGPHGERAGDLLLVPHDGDRDQVADRYYFAAPYRSFHGSASRQDSEIPLIVANDRVTPSAIRPFVDRVLGPHPTIARITDLILALRAHPPR